jgi:small subunit ribosomal protein S14
MAKTALRVKAARKPKFAVRGYTRCQRCGRPKAVYRKFGLCRICLREMAHRGELPVVTTNLLHNQRSLQVVPEVQARNHGGERASRP